MTQLDDLGLPVAQPLGLSRPPANHNSPPPVADELASLARSINMNADWARDHGRVAIAHARDCGGYLIEAKKLVGHGEWKPWLAANTTVSYRTAARWMSLAKGKEIKRYDAQQSKEDLIAGSVLIEGIGVEEDDEPKSATVAHLPEAPPTKVEVKTPPAVADLPLGKPQRKRPDIVAFLQSTTRTIGNLVRSENHLKAVIRDRDAIADDVRRESALSLRHLGEELIGLADALETG